MSDPDKQFPRGCRQGSRRRLVIKQVGIGPEPGGPGKCRRIQDVQSVSEEVGHLLHPQNSQHSADMHVRQVEGFTYLREGQWQLNAIAAQRRPVPYSMEQFHQQVSHPFARVPPGDVDEVVLEPGFPAGGKVREPERQPRVGCDEIIKALSGHWTDRYRRKAYGRVCHG